MFLIRFYSRQKKKNIENRIIEGSGELFNEYRASVLQDEKYRGWLHNSVNVFNSTELYTLTVIKWKLLCVFYYSFLPQFLKSF